MAYKQKGCTPITAKIQKGTKGGVTNPLLKAMGVPMKSTPLKTDLDFQKREAKKPAERKRNRYGLYEAKLDPEFLKKKHKGRYYKNPEERAAEAEAEAKAKAGKEQATARAKAMKGDTPSNQKKSDNKPKSTASGKITGKIGSDLRKAQYDKKGWKYDDTIKGYDKSGNKIKTSTSKSKTADVRAPKVNMDSKLTKAPSYDTSKITGKPKASATAKPSKQVDRKQKAIDVKLTKAKAARAAGNTKKADRKERAAKRKTDRLNDIKKRKSSPAKQTMQQQNRKERREANLKAKRVAPKKGNAKMAKKAKVYGK